MKRKAISLGLMVLLGLSIMAISSSALAEETYFVFTGTETSEPVGCACNDSASISASQCACATRSTRTQMRACGCTTAGSETEESAAIGLDYVDFNTENPAVDNENESIEANDLEPWAQVLGSLPLQRVFSQEVKHLQIYLNMYIRQQAGNTQQNGISYLVENGIFDDTTENALRQFQIDQRISEIGVVGDETKAKLFEMMGNLLQ